MIHVFWSQLAKKNCLNFAENLPQNVTNLQDFALKIQQWLQNKNIHKKEKNKFWEYFISIQRREQMY